MEIMQPIEFTDPPVFTDEPEHQTKVCPNCSAIIPAVGWEINEFEDDDYDEETGRSWRFMRTQWHWECVVCGEHTGEE